MPGSHFVILQFLLLIRTIKCSANSPKWFESHNDSVEMNRKISQPKEIAGCGVRGIEETRGLLDHALQQFSLPQSSFSPELSQPIHTLLTRTQTCQVLPLFQVTLSHASEGLFSGIRATCIAITQAPQLPLRMKLWKKYFPCSKKIRCSTSWKQDQQKKVNPVSPV